MPTITSDILKSATKAFDYNYRSTLVVVPTTSAYSIVTPDGADVEGAPAYACIEDRSVAPPSANYSVGIDVKIRTVVPGNSAGVLMRGSSSIKQAYYLQIYADGTLKLQRDGTWATLSSVPCPISAGTTRRVLGVVDGDQLYGYVDGVLLIGPITDAAITSAGYPGYCVWADSVGVSDSTGMAVSNFSADTLGGGSTNASADAGTGTSTGSGSGGAATAGSGGTPAAPAAGTGTSTGSGSGGAATPTASGSFTSDVLGNNTGSGIPPSTYVLWTWWQGLGGAAPTSLTHGSGITSASGVLALTNLPIGDGFLLAWNADRTAVIYQPGTVT